MWNLLHSRLHSKPDRHVDGRLPAGYRICRMRWAGSALFLLTVLGPGRVRAEGSGGSGGLGPGEHLEIPYAETEYWLYVPAEYSDDTPWPLRMFLHGDEGDPRDAAIWRYPPIWQLRQDAILVLPRAPFAGGSWWNDNEGHDAWLTTLVDTLLGQYNVDLDRITTGGVSGGATHLAYHALGQQDRYAAVHFHSGSNWWGIDSQSEPCETIAARWVLGDEDFLYDGARALYDRMEADGHGHLLEWRELPGVGHQIDDPAEWEAAYDWLAARTHGCATGSDADTDVDTDSDSDADSDTDVDADADGGEDTFEPQGACGCRTTGDAPAAACLWLLVSLGAVSTTRRR